jgi:hypothetical protein
MSDLPDVLSVNYSLYVISNDDGDDDDYVCVLLDVWNGYADEGMGVEVEI